MVDKTPRVPRPGDRAEAAVMGARPSKPAVIDHRFVADPRGGAPKVVGHAGVAVKDNRTKPAR